MRLISDFSINYVFVMFIYFNQLAGIHGILVINRRFLKLELFSRTHTHRTEYGNENNTP